MYKQEIALWMWTMICIMPISLLINRDRSGIEAIAMGLLASTCGWLLFIPFQKYFYIESWQAHIITISFSVTMIIAARQRFKK